MYDRKTEEILELSRAFSAAKKRFLRELLALVKKPLPSGEREDPPSRERKGTLG